MTSAVERFDEAARRQWRRVRPDGRVRDDELLRHPVYTRVLHWAVAIFFMLALLTGLGDLLRRGCIRLADAALRRRARLTRLLHPWFSLGFVVFFALQFLNWLDPDDAGPPDDRAGSGTCKGYVTNTETLEPEYVGFFNGGQKLYFWAIVVEQRRVPASPGFPMWFPRSVRPDCGGHQLRAARHRRAGHARRLHRARVRKHGRAAGHVPVDDARDGVEARGPGRIIRRGTAR